ncbi:hypothetical protein EJ06DRAFT_533001 [Trichodelitschia bisporula]|uniref:Uncharacterized protein n=1 Tax=Trichodelitschia bisporula TaxID=703511 RepID=A0A6G1HNG9_9PEZI|nr:hypothetical protein EJ06DRAFT_533001 [Trichodelitschia bisporula]
MPKRSHSVALGENEKPYSIFEKASDEVEPEVEPAHKKLKKVVASPVAGEFLSPAATILRALEDLVDVKEELVSGSATYEAAAGAVIWAAPHQKDDHFAHLVQWLLNMQEAKQLKLISIKGRDVYTEIHLTFGKKLAGKIIEKPIDGIVASWPDQTTASLLPGTVGEAVMASVETENEGHDV